MNIKGEPKVCPNCGAKLAPPEETARQKKIPQDQEDELVSQRPVKKREDKKANRSRQPENGSASEPVPWRHDPVKNPAEHSLVYKIMVSLTGALFFAAVAMVILALRATGMI